MERADHSEPEIVAATFRLRGMRNRFAKGRNPKVAATVAAKGCGRRFMESLHLLAHVHGDLEPPMDTNGRELFRRTVRARVGVRV